MSERIPLDKEVQKRLERGDSYERRISPSWWRLWFHEWRGALEFFGKIFLVVLFSYGALAYFQWNYPVHSEKFGRWILAENHQVLESRILERFAQGEDARIELRSFESNVVSWTSLQGLWQSALDPREEVGPDRAVGIHLSMRWLPSLEKYAIIAQKVPETLNRESSTQEEIEIRRPPPSFAPLMAWLGFLGALLLLPRVVTPGFGFSSGLLWAPWLGLIFGLMSGSGFPLLGWLAQFTSLFANILSETTLWFIPAVLFLNFVFRMSVMQVIFVACGFLLVEGLYLFFGALTHSEKALLKDFSIWSVGLAAVLYLFVFSGINSVFEKHSFKGFRTRRSSNTYRFVASILFFSLGLMLFQSWISQTALQSFWGVVSGDLFHESLMNEWSKGFLKGLFVPLNALGVDLLAQELRPFRSLEPSAFSDGFLIGRLISPFHVYFWSFWIAVSFHSQVNPFRRIPRAFLFLMLTGLFSLLSWAYLSSLGAFWPPALWALAMAFIVFGLHRAYVFAKKPHSLI